MFEQLSQFILGKALIDVPNVQAGSYVMAAHLLSSLSSISLLLSCRPSEPKITARKGRKIPQNRSPRGKKIFTRLWARWPAWFRHFNSLLLLIIYICIQFKKIKSMILLYHSTPNILPPSRDPSTSARAPPSPRSTTSTLRPYCTISSTQNHKKIDSPTPTWSVPSTPCTLLARTSTGPLSCTALSACRLNK